MAHDNTSKQTENPGGSTKGTGASELPSTSTQSGQVGGSGKPITRDLKGSGQEDKGSKAQEEYTQDQAEFRPGDREKGTLNNPDKSAKDLAGKVNETAQDAKQSAQQLANEAQQKAKNMAHDAQETLGNVADEAKRNASAIAADQKEMAASRLRTFADTLRETGKSLEGEDEQMIGGYAQSAAGQIDRFAGYLQRNDTGDLINEVRNIAHRQPEIFIAGSLAVGFLLGRFLKSSQMLPGSGSSGQGQYRGGYQNRGDYQGYDGLRDANRPLRNYARGSYPRDYNRSDTGRGEVNRGDYGRGAYGGSAYPDLQYRDAMRGDAPYREEEFRGQQGYRQGATYSRNPDYGYDRTVSYGVQENPSGGSAGSADRSTDRSTTGPGYKPEEYGKTGYRGADSEANKDTQANKNAQSGKGYDDTTKSGDMNKQDPASVRGSQST
jgi:hypothetical protein